MEDLINYLVLGFFIISFLSSLFKKKPVKQEIKTGTKKTGNAPITNTDANEPLDPFEMFLSNFKETEPQHKQEELSEVDKYFEEALQKSTDSETPPVSQSYNDYMAPSKKEASIETENDLSRKKNLPPLSDVNKRKNKANEIRTALKNPTKLRDYILINEILGKPKALQE
jgi:hypothetical protein